ncbi:MAG: aminoglycoside phosphotransferase family protein [Acidimicrobiales bacterium]
MTWPAAEVSIDESLVRDLLRAQYPELAEMECYQVAEGFDNALWRLGEELVVRVPRRAMAVALIENELRWLPEVARNVTLRTPLPLLRGVPSERFAWPWLIATWVDGVPGDEISLDTVTPPTSELAGFMRKLHTEAPPAAPKNPYRGVALSERSAMFGTRVQGLDDVLDVATAKRLWSTCLDAPVWDGAPRWLHGDLHPGNLLYGDRELVGVVDFGDLCAGDPATDLAGALMSLPFDALEEFFDAYGVTDSAMLWRSIGWATLFGVFMTSLGVSDRPSYLAVGQRTLYNAERLAAS